MLVVMSAVLIHNKYGTAVEAKVTKVGEETQRYPLLLLCCLHTIIPAQRLSLLMALLQSLWPCVLKECSRNSPGNGPSFDKIVRVSRPQAPAATHLVVFVSTADAQLPPLSGILN